MKRILTISLICLILTPCTALAQQPTKPKVGVSEELGKALEVALAELEHLRNQLKLKDQIIDGKDQQIAALKVFTEIQRAQVAEWSKAALERKDALASDDKTFKLQEAEITRVRAERDSARRAQKTWGVGGLIIGVVVGVLSQRKN